VLLKRNFPNGLFDGRKEFVAIRDYMRMIPGRVAKVDEGDDGDEEVNRSRNSV